MPKVPWAVLCTRSIIDRQANSISLIDIVEQLNAPALPEGLALVPATFDLVTFWTRGDDNELEAGEGRVRMIAPNGTTTLTGVAQVDLAQHERVRNIARLNGLPLSGVGRYTVLVDFKRNGQDVWSELYRFSLPVTNAPEPAQTQATGTE
jgi:hypothetical protein